MPGYVIVEPAGAAEALLHLLGAPAGMPLAVDQQGNRPFGSIPFGPDVNVQGCCGIYSSSGCRWPWAAYRNAAVRRARSRMLRQRQAACRPSALRPCAGRCRAPRRRCGRAAEEGGDLGGVVAGVAEARRVEGGDRRAVDADRDRGWAPPTVIRNSFQASHFQAREEVLAGRRLGEERPACPASSARASSPGSSSFSPVGRPAASVTASRVKRMAWKPPMPLP